MVKYLCEICGENYSKFADAKECESQEFIDLNPSIGSVFQLKNANSAVYILIWIGMGNNPIGLKNHYPFFLSLAFSGFIDRNDANVPHHNILGDSNFRYYFEKVDPCVFPVDKNVLTLIEGNNSDKIIEAINSNLTWFKINERDYTSFLESVKANFYQVLEKGIPLVELVPILGQKKDLYPVYSAKSGIEKIPYHKLKDSCSFHLQGEFREKDISGIVRDEKE